MLEIYITQAHIIPFLNDLPLDFPTTSCAMQSHHSLATYVPKFTYVYICLENNKINIKLAKNLKRV